MTHEYIFLLLDIWYHMCIVDVYHSNTYLTPNTSSPATFRELYCPPWPFMDVATIQANTVIEVLAFSLLVGKVLMVFRHVTSETVNTDQLKDKWSKIALQVTEVSKPHT